MLATYIMELISEAKVVGEVFHLEEEVLGAHLKYPDYSCVEFKDSWDFFFFFLGSRRLLTVGTIARNNELLEELKAFGS